MPLRTFFNLSASKRKELTDTAFEEFALHEYHTASINNIVKKLKIAKGSFYRYFPNKQNLYFYLIAVAEKMRFQQVNALLADKDMDFFEIMVENFAAKIRFDMQYPLQSGFLYNVMQEKNNEEIGNIQIKAKQQILKIVSEMLEPLVEQKKIRSDLPVFDMAYLVVQVQWGVYDYLEMKYGVDFRENVKNKKPVFTIPENKILEDVRSFSRLLKNGMNFKPL